MSFVSYARACCPQNCTAHLHSLFPNLSAVHKIRRSKFKSGASLSQNCRLWLFDDSFQFYCGLCSLSTDFNTGDPPLQHYSSKALENQNFLPSFQKHEIHWNWKWHLFCFSFTKHFCLLFITKLCLVIEKVSSNVVAFHILIIYSINFAAYHSDFRTEIVQASVRKDSQERFCKIS